ncbi:MAG TPA: homogentisate 1,2-dioxygenase [Phenylobacterium sp.]|nr:homogentisate 1,2-dioxygenase [Phenylobacterium sp.]
MRAAGLALALILCATGAAADPATQACEPLPGSLSTWGAATTVATTVETGGLKLGVARDLSLAPTTQVALPVTPAKPGAPDSFSGLVAFDVAAAGDYQVALGAPAWIEVVGNGASVASTRHSHGPACSGVRKIVVFTLAPGRHLLEIVGASAPTVRVMVAPAEQPTSH